MTPTPPSTTSSSGHSPDNQYRVVRKRNRVPLSCAPCRHKKLKCNRSHPCENCIRRGDAAGCSYAAPGPRKKGLNQGGNSPDDMQNRIDRLEGLVLSLMTNGSQSAGPTAAVAAISRSTSESGPSSGPTLELDYENDDMIKEEEDDSDVDEVSKSFGVLKVDNETQKSMYVGESHWHLVLAHIAEVRNYFINHKRELDAQYTKVANAQPATAAKGLVFLYNTHLPLTDKELRAALPPKTTLEKLVSRFFNSIDPAVQIMHYKTFHDELNAYFENPNSQTLAWVGMLYAILCLAMQSYSKVGDEPPEWRGRTNEIADEFRLRTVQALHTSEYTKPSLYTIETLVLYLHGEYAHRHEIDMNLWIVASTTTRLAMRMGYHRDGAQFGVSPFQAEMRRRVWLYIRQCDIIFSFQMALPNMIKATDCDTDFPRNLFDDEFDINSKELPPARPNTESTPMSYILAKAKFAFMLGEILEDTQSIGRQVTYDDIMRKDQKLRDIQADLPPYLKLRPLNESVLDTASLLMQRYSLDILYQKTLCVLHRRYIARSRTNPRYAHSRRTSIEASMTLLAHQEQLHKEALPGGRLYVIKWFVSSMQKNDFLLGAMIVCLDLNYDSTAEKYDRFFWTPEQRANMLRCLENVHELWKAESEASIEAFKASEILRIMLEKLHAAQRSEEQQTSAEVFAKFDDNLQPEHSAAMTLGMLSSGGVTPNAAMMFGNPGLSTPGKFGNPDMSMNDGGPMPPGFATEAAMGMNAPSPYSQVFGAGNPNIMDLPANLDWDAWDQYIQNGNSVDPAMQFYPPGFDTATPNVPQDLPMEQNPFENSVFMGANTPGRN